MSKISAIAPKIVWDCTESCKFDEHARLLLSCVTKKNLSDRQVAYYLNKTCRNFSKITDSLGKSVLHLAAACGRKDLCEWLVTKVDADVNAADFESGYTALHCAIFYGNVDVAVKLIELGAKLFKKDREHISPLSLLPVDTLAAVPRITTRTEAYVWGSNLNYTLGLGTNDSKKTPELLEFFRRSSLSIEQICMEDFHTVFVTSCCHVYVCGHGQGGRLGIGKEKPMLVPTQLPTRGEPCIQAAVGLNHTLLLLSNKSVLSCGSNIHHQLGITPYSEYSYTPRYVNLNALKSYGNVSFICAAKYHSVFCTNKAIFACGLNAGQLGGRDHHMDFFTVPQQLAVINKEHDLITHVSTSLGSITYITNFGDIVSFYNFQFKKIMRCPDIVKLESQGGRLVSLVNGIETGEDLKLVWLTSKGIVFVWLEKVGLTKCCVGAGQALFIKDICLRNNTLLFVSKFGEAFSGTLKSKDSGFTSEKGGKQNDVPYGCSVDANRIPNVHRALLITCDPKGKNIAVIQDHPSNPVSNTCTIHNSGKIAAHMKTFLDQASVDDDLHDIVFMVGNERMAAHKFILESRGCFVSKLSTNSSISLPSDIPPVIFRELLEFVYSGDSDLLKIGKCNERFLVVVDPIKKLSEASALFGYEELSNILKNYRFEDGNVVYLSSDPQNVDYELQFSRSDFPNLSDVLIVCEDSITLRAHKCILAARMEYFCHMFMRGWTEATAGHKVHMQCSSRIFGWILDFLYSNRLPETFGCDDLESVVKLLIAADQYLIDDLKEECAICLSNMLSLKNCSTILQLASTYNECRLKSMVMEYIAYNLNALIESRSLGLLDNALLLELKEYFKTLFHNKYTYRMICPHFDAPSDDEVISASIEGSGNGSPLEFPIIDEGDRLQKNIGSAKKKSSKKSLQSVDVTSSPPTKPSELMFESPRSLSSSFEVSPLKSSFNDFEFPELSPSYSARSPPFKSDFISSGPRRVYPPKLSQKQRKKLSTEFEEKLSLEANKPKSFKGWAKIEPPAESPLSLSRSPVNDSPKVAIDGSANLVDIIAFEQQKRSNWQKMTSKPFHFTQMEDAAILHLEEFYNAGSCFEERITITRVLPTNVAQPTWAPSKTLPVL